MNNDESYVQLANSIRKPLPNSKPIGDADGHEVIEVSLHLRAQKADEREARIASLAGQRPRDRVHLTREQLASEHGADSADITKVTEFASSHGLAVKDVNPAERTIRVTGTIDALSSAFRTKASMFRHLLGTYRARTEPLHVPRELVGILETVLGFDTRPIARPHLKSRSAAAVGTSFTPPELAALYGFPVATGIGQVIGIIELAAPKGSGYRLAELRQYFQSLDINPPPKVSAVSVDGGVNRPGTDPSDEENADGEVMLDIEVIGSLAPGAKLVVYFAPNTPQGFADVIKRAVYDQRHRPTVISLSWGGAETEGDSTYAQIDQALQDAVQLGVTVCVASGDDGSRHPDFDPEHATVDFPASHPNVLACGGTRLTKGPNNNKTEVVWSNSSGGGISRIFPLPDYQQGAANVPHATNPAGPVMRGVPDVAGNADPATGYEIVVDGQRVTYGGTSAVAPLWAALVARINEAVGKPIGFLNPTIYQHPEVLNDIIDGAIQDYRARAGWDPCTGYGTPNGNALLAVV